MAARKTKQEHVWRASSSQDRLSPATENYLLSLYILKEEGIKATLSRLAEYFKSLPPSEGLGTSLPSVAGMVRRMQREGLVEPAATEKEILLTKRGQVLAEDMVRRHRIAERMAVDLLGVELYRAHIEAHRLEHAISPELLAHIVERLGGPTTCPFGRPIPGSGYTPPSPEVITLEKGKPGASYIVDRVPEEDQDLLRFLVENSVIPGHDLIVKEAAPYRGVISIQSDLGEVSIGYGVAGRIWVVPGNRRQREKEESGS